MSRSIKPPHQTLTQFWRTIRANIEFGETSEKELSDFEKKYGVQLPHEFREYLRWACPTRADQMDGEMTTWWELDRIKSLSEELEGTDFFKNDPTLGRSADHSIVFADHMMWSWAWAICCEPGNDYGRIIQLYETGEIVSNSFGEFVQAYLKFYDDGLPLPRLV